MTFRPYARLAHKVKASVNFAARLLTDGLEDHPLVPPTIALEVKNLLPRAQIELAGRDRKDDLMAEQKVLEMRVAVVLARPVMPVVGSGRGIVGGRAGGELLHPGFD